MLVNHCTELYGDIFKLREKIINDYKMKKRLDKITARRPPYTTDMGTNTFQDKLIIKQEPPSPKKNELKLPQIKTYPIENKKSLSNSNKSLMEVMVDSKKIVSRIKEEKIQIENEKFLGKLLAVKSALRVDVMNESFRRSRDYMSIACKVRDHGDMTRKVIKSLRLSDGVTKVQEDIKKMLNI